MVSATVFMPERSSDFFTTKIEAYRNENTRSDKPKPKNQALIARIEDVRLAGPRELFTDDITLFQQFSFWRRRGIPAGAKK